MTTKSLPHLRPVKSSNIESVGYDASKNELAVKFKSSAAAYVYTNVPTEVHDALTKAESVGKFIGAHVVGKYSYAKVFP